MRVERAGMAAPAAVGRRRAGSGFRLDDATEPVRAAAPGVSAAVAASALGLRSQQGQALPAESPERRLEMALDDLGTLQRALLGENPGSTILERIAKQAEALPGDDPVLRDVAAAIGLRVRVELARRQKMGGLNTTKE